MSVDEVYYLNISTYLQICNASFAATPALPLSKKLHKRNDEPCGLEYLGKKSFVR